MWLPVGVSTHCGACVGHMFVPESSLSRLMNYACFLQDYSYLQNDRPKFETLAVCLVVLGHPVTQHVRLLHVMKTLSQP